MHFPNGRFQCLSPAKTIFISDAYIKYAKLYAVQKILDEI